MIAKIRELFNSIENHMDLLDAFAEKVENAFSAIRKHYGY